MPVRLEPLMLALLGCVGTVAAVIVVRRAQGAASGELGALSLFVLASLAAGVLYLSRRALAPPASTSEPGLRIVPRLTGLRRHAPALVAVLVLLALWPSSRPGAGLLLALPLLAVQLGWVDKAWARRRQARATVFRVLPRQPRPVARKTIARLPVGPAREETDCLQQFERRRLIAGDELITGEVRVVVPAGMRTGAAHLAFCPPFSQSPSVACDIVSPRDGSSAHPGATVRPDPVWPHAARIEIRLPRPAAVATVLRLSFRVQGPVSDVD